MWLQNIIIFQWKVSFAFIENTWVPNSIKSSFYIEENDGTDLFCLRGTVQFDLQLDEPAVLLRAQYEKSEMMFCDCLRNYFAREIRKNII